MKKLNLFTLFIIGLLITSCSNDDNEVYVTPKYIKEVTQPYMSTPLIHSFKFDQGLLTSATGNTILAGNYEYDSYGRLTSKTTFNYPYTYEYTYEYDSLDRIIKENKVGTNDYIELIYKPGKVITKRYYEYEGNPQNEGGSFLEERELQLDSQGRIIKMIDLAQDQSYHDIEYEEYLYDSNGNITKIIRKNVNKPTESVENLEYDDKVNPYYIAFEKYYNLTYYLENFYGVALTISSGLTPNNIVNIDGQITIDYVYDDDGYPISLLKFFVFSNLFDSQGYIEYY